MEFKTISDEEWRRLKPLFSGIEQKGPGQPHTDWRRILNSILHWVHFGKWEAVPKQQEYAPRSTANRWYVKWKNNSFLDQISNAIDKIRERKLGDNIGIEIVP